MRCAYTRGPSCPVIRLPRLYTTSISHYRFSIGDRPRSVLRSTAGVNGRHHSSTNALFATSPNDTANGACIVREESDVLDSGVVQTSTPKQDIGVVPVSCTGLCAPSAVVRADAWDEQLFTFERLEFESDVGQTSSTSRLIDHPALLNNPTLWNLLLSFRQRHHGKESALVFWTAIRQRNIILPVNHQADKLWIAFINLGFSKLHILEDICTYADSIRLHNGQTWPRLYTMVLQHFLLHGTESDVLYWHHRLEQHHTPRTAQMARCIRNVLHHENSTALLKVLYKQIKHRNLYSTIVPTLVGREDYLTALEWHFYLLRHKDRPLHVKTVEPLIQHFAIFDHRWARKITRSLVTAGVRFGNVFDVKSENDTKVSREMMNLIHGKAFNIGVKGYDDTLGARWFATRWVSLNTALAAVYTLGIDTIGPLSLQAIALRECTPAEVSQRIMQMKKMGISTGNSVYARAVERFASVGDAKNLRLLLQNDQDPACFEDFALQESLMQSALQNGDWSSYRHLQAVRQCSVIDPVVEEYNTVLRLHAHNKNFPALRRTLEAMEAKGLMVSLFSIRRVVRSLLGPPRRSRDVLAQAMGKRDVRFAASMLKAMMEHKNFVPLTVWSTILRRLGMQGQLSELERLSLWLADWYGPGSDLPVRSVGHVNSRVSRKSPRIVPFQVPSSHPLHPLRVLFSDRLQKCVVEWGFIYHSQSATPAERHAPRRTPTCYSSGIALLQHLSRRNVAINIAQVRRGIFQRLVVMFGAGESSCRRNRRLARENQLSFEQVVSQIDRAWGQTVFPDIENLKARIQRSHLE